MSRFFHFAAVATIIAALPLMLASPAHAQQRRLEVSDNGRHLVYENGEPFFYLGDTAWELFHRLDREEADTYLENRAERGFTVIQAVVLAELDGLNTPNPYGHTPLIDNDPARPNEDYFEHVDYIVDKAASLGMRIGMLPTWGDKFNKKWGVGPVVFTPENARAYGQFLGDRYKDKPIIWILGGDRNPESDQHLAIVRAMAEGIKAGDGGAHLMTYHPQGGSASWQWFHEDDWLDFNMFQSSHGRYDNPNYRKTLEGRELEPVKPVLDGEPRYEDHPVDWDPSNGWFDAFDIRQAAYWSMLAGACGHTYGDHNIWQMWQPGRDPISAARTPWPEAIEHPGAEQMGLMRKIFEARPWHRLQPDQSVIRGDNPHDAGHIRAAVDRDGEFLLAYSPLGRPIAIDPGKLSGDSAVARWFNPRTGQILLASGRFRTSVDGTTFRIEDEPGRGNDWLLILDSADADLPDLP